MQCSISQGSVTPSETHDNPRPAKTVTKTMFQVCTAFLASEQKFSPQLNNRGGLDLSTRRAADTGTHTHTQPDDWGCNEIRANSTVPEKATGRKQSQEQERVMNTEETMASSAKVL